VHIVADESVDGPIVRGLRAAGHEVTYVAELAPGLTDEAVLALACDTDSVLLTADKDFGELVFAKGLPHEGVVLARLHGIDPSAKASRVVTAVAGEGENLRHAFTVIDGQGCRRRA
jgi:predicted nuclease of predicted toxin-antitoxin system